MLFLRYMTVVSLLFGVIGFSAPAMAAKTYVTGKELQRYCLSSLNTDYGYCAGFITGVADVMFIEDIGGKRSCHKPTVRSQELIDLVLTYMEHHPEVYRNTARSIVVGALSQNFPCKAKR